MVIPQELFTSRYSTLRLVPCLVAFMLHSLARAQIFVQYECLDIAFSAGSQYQTNLNRLLFRSFNNGGNDSIFSNATVGNHPDEVYGLFLCRGDVLAKTCQDCIDTASTRIVKECPYSKEAIIWYEQCLIRYSNTSFFSTLDTKPYLCWSNKDNNLTEPNNFSQEITDMFRNITDQATNNPANRMFAKADITITGIGNLTAMVQCTPDLSPLQCQKCLSSAFDNFANASVCPRDNIGKRILTPSCNTRYELYPFLEDPRSQPPDLGNRTDDGSKGRPKSKTLAIAISTIVSATLAIVILGFLTRYFFRGKGLKENDGPADRFPELTEDNYFPQNVTGGKSKKFPLIPLNLIRTATQQFSMENKLGEGGFGPVYKGTLVDGKEIAVKRLSRNSGQGLQEFKAEVTSIARLQHKNLVKLLGCCLEGEELLLVYDYMPNKSLDVHLFDMTRGARLDWQRRLNITNGIARGILYLHEDSRFKIIHRDLKASNILLDHDMNPKISDFGMARIFGSNQIEDNTNRVVGTYGYMAPEYAMEGIFSVKSDVFSFGVLLLEIVSGKKNCGFHLAGHGHSLLTYAWKLWSGGQGLELMDPKLSETCVESEVLKCIQIGLLCVQEDPADRPIMSSVILMLGSFTMPVPQPTEPAFSVGRAVPFSQQQTTNLESSSTICDLTTTDNLPR